MIFDNFQRQLLRQECLDELVSVFSDEASYQSTMSRWYEELKHGLMNFSDDPRADAPKTVVIQKNVDAMRKLIISSRKIDT